MPEAAARGSIGRIYGNLGRLIGGKAGAGLISLAYLAIAARALGPADYGVLILVHTYVMTVGGIIEFPGWHAIVRYGAQALANGDRPRLTRLLAFAGVVEAAGGVLAVIVAAVLAPIVGPKLGWSPEAVAFAGPYSLAVLASIRATPAGYLQLKGRFDLLGLHSLVAPAVRLLGALAAVLAHAGLKGFLIAWLAAALCEWLAMWGLGALVAWGRHARGDLKGGLARTLEENPGLWRFMLAANADVSVSELATRLTPLAVGWMLGPTAAGFYALAQRATSVLAQPAQILGQTAYAELARMAASAGQGARIRAAVSRAIGIALLAAAPVCLAILFFGRDIAVLLAGKAFAGAGPIMLWLTLSRGLQMAAPPFSAALTAVGRPGLSVWANLLSGFGLLLILPPMLDGFGLMGAGLHAVIQAVVGVGVLALLWREADADGVLGAEARV